MFNWFKKKEEDVPKEPEKVICKKKLADTYINGKRIYIVIDGKKYDVMAEYETYK